MDQANSLRNLVEEKADIFVPSQNISARVITITSGKGGVGKTNFAVNLAIYLSKFNKRVVIIDADFGLANIEVLFGIVPQATLAHVLMGEKEIKDVLTEGPNGIKFISGGSGLKELANITDKQMGYLIQNFTYLDTIADIILVDTGAGISKSVVNFIKASNETVIITTPEPTSITDAYSLIKTIKSENGSIPDFKIVVNRTDDHKEGEEIYSKLSKVSEKFLEIPLNFLGGIPYDNYLVKAVKQQKPAILSYPNCTFSRSIETIGSSLLDIESAKNQQTGILTFMRRLVNIFGN